MDNKALGKGLSALIPEKAEEAIKPQDGLMQLKIESIKDNSLQPRVNYDESKLDELKASIKEKGVLQPILVRQKGDGYEVVAGERRLKAARALNLKELPVIIKEVSDKEAFVIALVENIQREDLNPIEEAQSYKKLMEEFYYTQEDVAKSVGKNRTTVSNMMRLLKLPEEIQQSLFEGVLTVGHARALLAVESLVDKKKLFEETIKNKYSVRDLESRIRRLEQAGSKPKKAQKQKMPELLVLEDNLQKTLGTKVNISSSKKRGKITIDYYSFDDLDRILQLIKK